MRWKKLKEAIEKAGVVDDDDIRWIDIGFIPSDDPTFIRVVKTEEGVTISDL